MRGAAPRIIFQPPRFVRSIDSIRVENARCICALKGEQASKIEMNVHRHAVSLAVLSLLKYVLIMDIC